MFEKEVENSTPGGRNRSILIVAGIVVLLGFYTLSRYNYLTFPAVSEVSTIVVAGPLFITTWHSRKFLNNNYLLLQKVHASLSSYQLWADLRHRYGYFSI